MRFTKGLIIKVAAGVMALSAIACQNDQDSTMRYNNATMGNIVDGNFISDQGNIFNVTEQTCKGKLDTMKRAFVICDVLNNTVNGEKNEYDVRVNYIANVLDKAAKPISEIEDLDNYMNDPIILKSVWFSAGYMNMLIYIPTKRIGGKIHELNLLYEEIESGKWKFSIRHNAEGEILTDTNDSFDFVMAYSYASFPISAIIAEDSATIDIEWKSYLESGYGIHAETKMITATAEYTKSSFEHVPQAAVTAASVTEME